MSDTEINYEQQVQTALRYVMRDVLSRVAKEGLPGEHHFYITFQTKADGVSLPAFLVEKYPDEMTIVIQAQFWNLEVDDHGFSIDLKFNGTASSLRIPFAAVVNFVDPSVQFALQFDDMDSDDSLVADTTDIFAIDTKEPTPTKEDSQANTDNVVTLDAFRKKS